MVISKRHLAEQPIPTGMQIYQDWIEVAGVPHHRDAALRFVRGKQLSLAFRPEPTNPHDASAIQIIGIVHHGNRAEQLHLGYLPAEIAAKVAVSGLAGQVAPRLKYTGLKDSGYIVIELQLLGPSGQKQAYLAAAPPDADGDDDDDREPAPRRSQVTTPAKRTGCLGHALQAIFLSACLMIALILIV